MISEKKIPVNYLFIYQSGFMSQTNENFFYFAFADIENFVKKMNKKRDHFSLNMQANPSFLTMLLICKEAH